MLYLIAKDLFQNLNFQKNDRPAKIEVLNNERILIRRTGSFLLPSATINN